MYRFKKPSVMDRRPSPKIINFHGVTDEKGKIELDYSQEMRFSDKDEISVSDIYMDLSQVENIKEGQYEIQALDLDDETLVTRFCPAAHVVTVEDLASLVESLLIGIRFSYKNNENLVMEGELETRYTLPIKLARCLGFLEASGQISQFIQDLNKGNAVIALRSTDQSGVPNVVDVTFNVNGSGKVQLMRSKNRNIWNYVSEHSVQTLFLYCDLVEPVLIGAGFFPHLLHLPFPEESQVLSNLFHVPTWQRVKKSFTRKNSITLADSAGNKLSNVQIGCNVRLKRRTFT